jgi:hypothetical protein
MTVLVNHSQAWIDADISRESNFDDVLGLIRFPLMTHADLGIASENPTANKFSRFGKVMLQALCDKCPMANARVLDRPDATFPSTVERAIAFVVHESVLRVTVGRARGSRTGIVVAITTDEDESTRGLFLFPYARCNDRRKVACGRPIALWTNHQQGLTLPYLCRASNTTRKRARDSSLARPHPMKYRSTIWDVEAGDSVDIALQVFTSPGSSTHFGTVKSIPCTSPFLWDVGDVDDVCSSTGKLCHEWLRDRLEISPRLPESPGW